MVSWHLLYLYRTQRGVKQFFVVAFQFYYTLCDVNAVFDKKKIAVCKRRCKKVRILLTKIEDLSTLNLTELTQLKQF